MRSSTNETEMQNKHCEFSPCRSWRYTLWRTWPIEDMLIGECSADTQAHRYLMVIGLNPSTADETKNDPTVARCINFAKRWGFGALCMTNLFGWRDTDPKKMKAAIEPIGADNDHWLRKTAEGAGMVLAAWGKHGSHLHRSQAVCELLNGIAMHALRLNRDGSPEHPLYMPAATVPIAFKL